MITGAFQTPLSATLHDEESGETISVSGLPAHKLKIGEVTAEYVMQWCRDNRKPAGESA